MDTDDPGPAKKKPEPKKLEEMSIEALGDYIAELEAEIGRARHAVALKKEARQGADSVFKS